MRQKMSGSARCIWAQKVSASDLVLKRTLFRICPARHCTQRHMVLVIVCSSAAALPCPGVPFFVCPFLCCISPYFLGFPSFIGLISEGALTFAASAPYLRTVRRRRGHLPKRYLRLYFFSSTSTYSASMTPSSFF